MKLKKNKNLSKDAKQKFYMAFVYSVLFLIVIWVAFF